MHFNLYKIIVYLILHLMCFCEAYKSAGSEIESERERERVMEAEEGKSIHTTNTDTNSYRITIGVCVMEKKVKCGSEVLFLVCFFFLQNRKQTLSQSYFLHSLLFVYFCVRFESIHLFS